MLSQVRALEPEVYVYCQNPEIQDLSALQPLLRYGGHLEHLDNLGRETHAFLTHIIKYYDQLQDHVMFSQDIPVDTKMWHRFQVRTPPVPERTRATTSRQFYGQSNHAHLTLEFRRSIFTRPRDPARFD